MGRVYGYGDINERSSKGQVGSNFQQHPICMNDISDYFSQLAHFKIYTFKVFELSLFEISPYV